jgi:hypothetical protein
MAKMQNEAAVWSQRQMAKTSIGSISSAHSGYSIWVLRVVQTLGAGGPTEILNWMRNEKLVRRGVESSIDRISREPKIAPRSLHRDPAQW